MIPRGNYAMSKDIDYRDLVIKDLNYNSYLKVSELLNLQHEVSGRGEGETPHHDEMFFIIIHQTAELWFKEVLHETEILVKSLHQNIISRALKALKRIKGIMNLQVEQIRLLSTLTPIEFAGFREYLKPASGFQSIQYRQIEFTYGIRNPFFLKFFEQLDGVADRLQDIMKEPSVYDDFLRMLDRKFCKIPESVLNRDVSKPWELNTDVVKALYDVYTNTPEDKYHVILLFEALLDLDEALILWRKTHATMVHRTIGHKTGTGGSTGYQFLTSRMDLQCFPELWEVRNLIGGSREGY
jgi:tryptophan 2,3-dioxygenase